MPRAADSSARVAVVGGGPAGLMAALVLAQARVAVDLFDAMPTLGRKFLVAGKGGLNLTHSDPPELFARRYGEHCARFLQMLGRFSPDHLRALAFGLGVETMVGSSGRVFPKDFKAAPFLRTLVQRLRDAGVRIHSRHRLVEIAAGPCLTFARADGTRIEHEASAAVLALGGGSWRITGSDGAWTAMLERSGVRVLPLQPANCAFAVRWSPQLLARAEGRPLKNLAVTTAGANALGELVVTRFGLEGNALYPLSAPLRSAIAARGRVTIRIDLKRELSQDEVRERLATGRGKKSTSEFLRRELRLAPPAIALMREGASPYELSDPARLAARVKSCPVELCGVAELDDAISSAGGVSFDAVDDHLMLRALPGVFVAGEMLDWEAPTGGYLLQGAFTTGFVAGHGALEFVKLKC
ncbi:MAG: TIGR03862 family flavoprotein [Planctomycetes bacterium]|nr:TIGR03862 family flavoprotein [Planctomycetota bacterium]MCC7169916.1 TIGR03862 family flavoprotein [Planctomycetota bacterium]